VSAGIHFVPEGQSIQLSIIIACHAVTAKNLSLFVSVELDNDYCDALLRVEKKDRLYNSDGYTILTKVAVYK
jgi:hypothetical protein